MWGMCAKGVDGRPIASPHITHVLAYDRAIRTLQAASMNAGLDMQTAPEKGLGRRRNSQVELRHSVHARLPDEVVHGLDCAGTFGSPPASGGSRFRQRPQAHLGHRGCGSSSAAHRCRQEGQQKEERCSAQAVRDRFLESPAEESQQRQWGQWRRSRQRRRPRWPEGRGQRRWQSRQCRRWRCTGSGCWACWSPGASRRGQAQGRRREEHLRQVQ